MKQRKSIRTLITKTTNDIEADLAGEQKDVVVVALRTKLGKLISYQEKIDPLDQQIELSRIMMMRISSQSIPNNGYPASADNYPKEIKALKDRFGNKKPLTQVYIRELFAMGLENVRNKPTISKVYDELISHVRSLESLGITVEQATLFLYPAW